MNPPKIIGFCGYPGSGKNHMARVLVKHFTRILPVTLALPFKLEAVANGRPYEAVFGSVKDPETRHYLRNRGTELGRDVNGEDWWVKHADTFIRYYHEMGFRAFAFTDVRFPNEAEYVRDNGGILIWLLGGANDLPDGHRSESYYDQLPITHTIDNSGACRTEPEGEVLRLAKRFIFSIGEFNK